MFSRRPGPISFDLIPSSCFRQAMTRLRSRQKQIPNGFVYRIPELNWDSRKVLGMHPSFETLVSAVISARLANPHHREVNKWSLDRDVVGDEIEAFNVKICLSMNWTDYLAIGGGEVPFPQGSSSPQELRQLDRAARAAVKLWNGIKITSNWKDSGEPAVAPEISSARALRAPNVLRIKKGIGAVGSQFRLPPR